MIIENKNSAILSWVCGCKSQSLNSTTKCCNICGRKASEEEIKILQEQNTDNLSGFSSNKRPGILSTPIFKEKHFCGWRDSKR